METELLVIISFGVGTLFGIFVKWLMGYNPN